MFYHWWVYPILEGIQYPQETLRKPYDYVQQIGYMPIVGNGSRGFFTSRVFGTFMDEGLQLMQDGMNPVAIERAAWKVGMPVGPLAVHDEVSMELSRKAILTQRKLDERPGVMRGFGSHNGATSTISVAMCALRRGGRHYGGGFYEYSADGGKKLWSGLSQFKLRDAHVSMELLTQPRAPDTTHLARSEHSCPHP
jgi:3-hydroxyacyl-CoA dehydrogenase/enoyl-CoA hydratase/3-hydroxybutyryl-CoA epimerase